MTILTTNITLLNQRDPRWANQRLGTINGTTIGGYGCIITCMAMLASYYGHTITPDAEDNWLTDNTGYAQGNMYRNDSFAREFSNCTYDGTDFYPNPTPADLTKAINYLNQGKPVVFEVDFDHDPNDGIQTHFILGVGNDEKGIIIDDPWYGDQVHMVDRYGDPKVAILQINYFSGPVPLAHPEATAPIMPAYLVTLFQEHNLDPNNEGAVRSFWQGGIDYPVVDKSLGEADDTITSLNERIKILEAKITEEQLIVTPTPTTTPIVEPQVIIAPPVTPIKAGLFDWLFAFFKK